MSLYSQAKEMWGIGWHGKVIVILVPSVVFLVSAVLLTGPWAQAVDIKLGRVIKTERASCAVGSMDVSYTLNQQRYVSTMALLCGSDYVWFNNGHNPQSSYYLSKEVWKKVEMELPFTCRRREVLSLTGLNHQTVYDDCHPQS